LKVVLATAPYGPG